MGETEWGVGEENRRREIHVAGKIGRRRGNDGKRGREGRETCRWECNGAMMEIH